MLEVTGPFETDVIIDQTDCFVVFGCDAFVHSAVSLIN